MAVYVTLHSDDSPDEARDAVRELEKLGYTPLGAGHVFEAPGRRGRWMARAERAQQRQPGRTWTRPNDAS